MSYQQKDNSGALFKNENKEQDTHADYRGSALIGGVDYFVDVWVNTAESGRKYMSLRFKEKDKQSATAPAPRPAARTHGDRPGGPKNRPQAGGFDDDGSDIPF